jgi:hypothetical protein
VSCLEAGSSGGVSSRPDRACESQCAWLTICEGLLASWTEAGNRFRRPLTRLIGGLPEKDGRERTEVVRLSRKGSVLDSRWSGSRPRPGGRSREGVATLPTGSCVPTQQQPNRTRKRIECSLFPWRSWRSWRSWPGWPRVLGHHDGRGDNLQDRQHRHYPGPSNRAMEDRCWRRT